MSPAGRADRDSLRRSYGVGADRLDDVLDAVATERSVVEGELVPDLLVDGVRDADAARLCEFLQPRRDVDAVAKNVVAVDDHIAEIDADAQLQPSRRRYRLVEHDGGLLYRNSAIERIDNAGEIGEQAVAGGADDAPAVIGNQRIDSPPHFGERLVGPALVLPHQSAETRNIRVEDRGKLPPAGGDLHGFDHRE